MIEKGEIVVAVVQGSVTEGGVSLGALTTRVQPLSTSRAESLTHCLSFTGYLFFFPPRFVSFLQSPVRFITLAVYCKFSLSSYPLLHILLFLFFSTSFLSLPCLVSFRPRYLIRKSNARQLIFQLS